MPSRATAESSLLMHDITRQVLAAPLGHTPPLTHAPYAHMAATLSSSTEPQHHPETASSPSPSPFSFSSSSLSYARSTSVSSASVPPPLSPAELQLALTMQACMHATRACRHPKHKRFATYLHLGTGRQQQMFSSGSINLIVNLP